MLKTTERDSLEEIYETKKVIGGSFHAYEEFAAWLLSEQSKAKSRGVKFVSA